MLSHCRLLSVTGRPEAFVDCGGRPELRRVGAGDGLLEARDGDSGDLVETVAAPATRRHARDIRHAEMVVVGTYATAVEVSVSFRR
jgi:hypothetical protein